MSISTRLVPVLLSLAGVLAVVPSPAGEAGRADTGRTASAFVIILDCSGSMKEPTDTGETKWSAAQKAALGLIDSIPAGREVAFIVYGHKAALACKAVETIRPLAPLNAAGKAELRRKILALTPEGHTPIALSLRTAAPELARTKGSAKVVLITDGMETCHGDPVKEAAALVRRFPNLHGGVDVIGLGLKDHESKAVAKIATAGKGKYYDAKTVKKLESSLRILEEEMARPPFGKPGLLPAPILLDGPPRPTPGK